MDLIVGLLLLMAFFHTSADTVTGGTELLLSFMVFRHGDRTPTTYNMRFANDSETLEKLIAPWGYGQLTDVGKRTAYKTGQFIRRRYDGFLPKTYNKSEIYIRSTDITRTKMTVLSAMAPVFPAVGRTWSDEINWVPVPYTTLPVKYDTNLAFASCPVYGAAYTALLTAPTTRMSDYDDVIEKLSNITGRTDLTNTPVMACLFYDLYVSERSLGVDLGEEINALMPRLEAAAGVAVDVIWGDENYIALQAGVLLKEFFDVAASVIAGNATQKVRVYSAHDFNVYSFEAVTGVERQGVPNYASLYSLELRRVTKTGQYVVLPVYLPSPYSTEKYLNVQGCGDDVLCDLDTFYNLTSKNILDEDSYRTKCEWSSDLVVNSAFLD